MAKKQGSDQHHQGKVLKYLGYKDFNDKFTYSIQFEDGTEENVSDYDYANYKSTGDIQVRTKW